MSSGGEAGRRCSSASGAVPAKVFTLWQVLGGLLWTAGVILAGYALGASVPNIDTYLLPIVAVVMLVSLSPLFTEFYHSRRRRAS